MGAACALGIASCKDKEGEPASAPAAKETAPAAPETPAAVETPAAKPAAPMAENKEALLDYMIFHVGKQVGEYAGNAAWYEQVRDMRNMLEEYYNTLMASGEEPKTCMRLGLLLADITRTMRVYDKASKLYNDTLAQWESQPEAERQSLEGRRMRSSIANGMGSCNLLSNKAADALPHYEKALEIDKAIYDELLPAGDGALPTGNGITPDLERAAEDVLSSYRCLGDCLRWADDPEEARDTYKKGQALAVRMNNLRPGTTLQFIRLLSALGDLENSCGQLKNAQGAWVSAFQLGQNLLKMNLPAATRAKVIQDMRKLEESLKAISPKLRAELEAAQAAEAESAEPVTEPQNLTVPAE